MDFFFFHFTFVSRRASFCKSFCIQQMSNAKSLQNDSTDNSISKPIFKLQKGFADLSPLTFGPLLPYNPPSQRLPLGPLPPKTTEPSPTGVLGHPLPTPEPSPHLNHPTRT